MQLFPAIALAAAIAASQTSGTPQPPGGQEPVQSCPMAAAASESANNPRAPAQRPAYVYSLDHGGSLGLQLGFFGNYTSSEKGACLTCETDSVSTGWSGSLDIAATLGIGWEGAEFILRFQMMRLGSLPGESIGLGFRNYFGRDEWKTFLDLELLGAFRPVGGGGIRGAFGVIWDIHPLVGIWSEAGASIVLGRGRTFGAQFGVGIQVRSYLFQKKT